MNEPFWGHTQVWAKTRLAFFAPDRSARHRFAPDRSARHRFAPDRSAPDRFAPDRSATYKTPKRCTSKKHSTS